MHRQTTSGVLLMLCAIVALYIANSQWSTAYHHILELPYTIGFPGFELSKSLDQRWFDGTVFVRYRIRT